MTSAIEVRQSMVDFLRKELIGPDPRPGLSEQNGGEEILRPQDPPRVRYGAGVLFPSGTRMGCTETLSEEEAEAAEKAPAEGEASVNEDQADYDVEQEAVGAEENEVNRANDFLPSAMGLTALVRLDEGLRIELSAARYESKIRDGVGLPNKKTGKWQPHHWRIPLNLAPVEISSLDLLKGEPTVFEKKFPIGTDGQILSIHLFIRQYEGAEEKSKDRMVTFTMINRTPMKGEKPKDSECFFQCGFKVLAKGAKGGFLDYPQHPVHDDEEEKSLRLLYRDRRTFAIGHGCAAAWPMAESEPMKSIWTDSLPTFEMKPVLPKEIPGLELAMAVLMDPTSEKAISTCKRLGSEYLKWIQDQESAANSTDFPDEHRKTANDHLALCRLCHSRIVKGVEVLKSSPLARQAFAWMNQAMLEQQLHYHLASAQRREWVINQGVESLDGAYSKPDILHPPPGKGMWRPFQLAFILMNIACSIDEENPERKVVDLIWFPTGGGKTEAYLGLTAFTIFLRRLKKPSDSGTTVLMRYTLRLLTTQQFQRASSLICACETIRRNHAHSLGHERISIGLWVGSGVTPNRNKEALTSLRRLIRDGKPNEFVVLTCPWCGAGMGPVRVGNIYKAKGYKENGGRVIFQCPDTKCEFSNSSGLPLHVVDESIYLERPTLVIGTVDKFAMVPWEPESRNIFGLNDTSPLPPPELIIQDELHLISGALGSMVGIYEATIDALCSGILNEVRKTPKIIASTATICQAPQQVKSLYARPVFLFPPLGLKAGESFFAEEAIKDSNGQPVPGRLYVGVFCNALSSHVTAQIRVISSLLQGVKSSGKVDPALLDPYWTLMAYFNSIRELGHAATLLKADIREYMNAVWDRLNIRRPSEGSGQPDLRRFIDRDLELTSRIKSSEITDVLQQLFNPLHSPGDSKPVDVCLATNMIQVGLDVPRLGLMAVVGQPKTTSEYIQATSRVGRSSSGPGLVATVYGVGKPRDRSHFEHFRSYHQSIYRWVEPTSVTPFAIRVRERALHAQIIGMVRMAGTRAMRERPMPIPQQDFVARVKHLLSERVSHIDPSEHSLSMEMFDAFISDWARSSPIVYGRFGTPPDEVPMMYPSGSEPDPVWRDRAKATPTSMRNVDAGCSASVIANFPKVGDHNGVQTNP